MRRPAGGMVVHVGEVIEGTPRAGDTARAEVDAARRADITRNHTGTHLLHAALRSRLGTHVQQRGSLVAPDRLRFDFAHDSRVSAAELAAIEADVNEAILRNYPVRAEEKPLAQARQEGAMALFGEKYGEVVRTIVIADGGAPYSYELCGGVHVRATAEIGPLVIVSEGSVSAGIRRVEALTGHGALAYLQHQAGALHNIAARLGAAPEEAEHRVAQLQDELAAVRKEAAGLRRDLARRSFDALLASTETVNGARVLVARVDDAAPDTLREMSDWFRGRVESGAIVLGSVVEGRPQILVALTDDLTKRGLNAGSLIKPIAGVVGGGGGGRPNLAQAGGKDASRLAEALDTARQLIRETIQR